MSAGFFLAMALFKFQIVMPIAVLIAIRQGWRFAMGFLSTAAGVGLLSMFIVGWRATTDYLHLLMHAGLATNDGSVVQHSMGIYNLAMPNITGLLYASGGLFLSSTMAFNALSVICSVGLFVWCALMMRRSELKVAFSIAVLCGLLVSFHLFNYDLTLALLPVALLAGRTHRYILLLLFALPIALSRFGSNPFSLLALPLLAMLFYTIATSKKPAELAPAAVEMASL